MRFKTSTMMHPGIDIMYKSILDLIYSCMAIRLFIYC